MSEPRLTFYHICGAEIYAEPVAHKENQLYHYVYYSQKKGGRIAAVCAACGTRVGRKSVRLPGEQLLAEMAADTLELSLELQRQRDEEEDDAET